VTQHTESTKRPSQLFRNLSAKIASVPMIVTVLVVFVGGTTWTVVHSFTKSKLLPKLQFVGFDQYERLWGARRWLISIENLALYGVLTLVFTLVIGFTLAALLDRKIRGESVFRTIFLYPFALSYIVTGLAWQWILNPDLGVQKVVRDLGWSTFSFNPLNHGDTVMYGVLIAGLWQGTGLIMVIMLAGLRGIDDDIWKAARSGIIKLYDLVVALTNGGPGLSSEVPAKYVIQYMFRAQNLGQGFAASTMMLVSVAIILIPWAYLEFGGKKRG